MEGLNYWWRRWQRLKKMLDDYKKKNKIDGDVEEVVEHLLKAASGAGERGDENR